LLAGCASAAIIREISPLVAAPGAEGALARIVTISVLFSVLYLTAVVLLHGGPEPLYRFARLWPDVVPWASYSRSISLSEESVARVENSRLWPEKVN